MASKVLMAVKDGDIEFIAADQDIQIVIVSYDNKEFEHEQDQPKFISEILHPDYIGPHIANAYEGGSQEFDKEIFNKLKSINF